MKEKWTTENIGDLSGKNAIVSGSNSGIGYEAAKELAGKNARVIIACRNRDKGEKASLLVREEYPEASVEVRELDLGSLQSIKDFSEAYLKENNSLDLLINNAGVMMPPYGKTRDGFELQFGTNHLGHFALTAQLMKMIKATAGSRVVNVSSGGHRFGKMDFDNLLFEDGKDYSPMKAYGRSKLSNLLFTYELERQFESSGIKAIAVASHPGGSRTNLDRHVKGKIWFKLIWPIFRLMTMSQALGALPQIRASVDGEVKGGQYYGPHRNMTGYPVVVKSNQASHSMADARKLWEMSEELTGISFDF